MPAFGSCAKHVPSTYFAPIGYKLSEVGRIVLNTFIPITDCSHWTSRIPVGVT